MTSPFKFLDSYTKEDKEIFFGRDKEIEELYHKVFENKTLLVYGVSGTGKSSLINCGLSGKFSESDWLPVNIRRGGNITESIERSISALSLTTLKINSSKEGWLKKALHSLYLDHFKPVFLIFDQFEELFIFGSKSEKEAFVKLIKDVIDSDLQCRFVFVIREEYLAGITEFEKTIPSILANRVRIEKMSRLNAKMAVEGPCKFSGIELEEGFSDQLLNKLSPDSNEIELTYLQVYLDKIYKLVSHEKTGNNLQFTHAILDKTGDVKDLLGSFLDDQISELSDPDIGLAVLKAFVSTKGTKRQITESEVFEFCRTLGKDLSAERLRELIQHFVSLRILRDKDESGRFELRHDALALKIYEKISLVEKELLEVRQFIENSFDNYQRRKIYLSTKDLSYFAPYEDKMFLSEQLISFINDSRRMLSKIKRRKRTFAVSAAILLFVVLSGFTFWALNERTKAKENEKTALIEKEKALKAINEADVAKKEADSLRLVKKGPPSAVISATKMNVLYLGIDNPITVAVPGFSAEDVYVSTTGGKLKKGSNNTEYIIFPQQENQLCYINVSIRYRPEDTAFTPIGRMGFRVYRIPDPEPFLCEKKGGKISKKELLNNTGIIAEIKNSVFDLKYSVTGFVLMIEVNGLFTCIESKSSTFNESQIKAIKQLKKGQDIFISDIKAMAPDGKERYLNGIIFSID